MPLSFCWSAFYQIRRFGYEYGLFIQNSFRVPIISIGNITFGGTGKTPFTLWIAQYLEERNKKDTLSFNKKSSDKKIEIN